MQNSLTPPIERMLCHTCVGDFYLRQRIVEDGSESMCFYCGDEGKALPVQIIAAKTKCALEDHFEITSNNPDIFDWILIKEGGSWEREGSPIADIIVDMAKVEPEVAEDIRAILSDEVYDHEREKMGEEGPYDKEAQYSDASLGPGEYSGLWSFFEQVLKKHARFFGRSSREILDEIFEKLEDLTTSQGKSVLVDAGPQGTISGLYRARVFQSDVKLETGLAFPDVEIGTPAFQFSTAGRMNAAGIAVFYGATKVDIALAEVRPPVGSNVVVGYFEILRPLRLLNVEELKSIQVKGSFYDPLYKKHIEHASFLEVLSHRISKPVMPDDAPFEYLTTQAIADYCSNVLNLDGLIYPCTQTDSVGANVVLFHPSSRVEKISSAPGTKIEVNLEHNTESGPEPDFTVWEVISKKPLVEPVKEEFGLSVADVFAEADPDDRPVSLKLDLTKLQVVMIKSVKFGSETFSVMRSKYSLHDGDSPF